MATQSLRRATTEQALGRANRGGPGSGSVVALF